MIETCPPRYEEAGEVWARFVLGDYGSVLGQIGPMMGADGLAFLTAVHQATAAADGRGALSRLLAQRDGVARAWSLFMADAPADPDADLDPAAVRAWLRLLTRATLWRPSR